MGKRGRPPYPDILTPREREVLALIREGLRNEDIAGRLGISIDGVKFHVSQILSKLGVSSRQEAAEWKEDQRPWWQRALAPLAWVWRTSSLAIQQTWIANALVVVFLLTAISAFTSAGILLWRTHHRPQNVQAEPAAAIPTPINGWPGMMYSFFVDGSHGWVPLHNVLFQTIDGGASWVREYEATQDIGGVYFASPQVGRLVSGDEILVSQDGGHTWQSVGYNVPKRREGASYVSDAIELNYVDARDAWARGITFKFYRTTDGGVSWDPVDEPCSQVPGSSKLATSGGTTKFVEGPFSFISSETGWAACFGDKDGGLFRTDDAGKSWKLIGKLPGTAVPFVGSLQFIDWHHGWLADDAGLHATDDGGKSWRTVAKFANGPGFSGVRFVSARQGFLNFVGGVRGPSAIFSTQDGGRTWTQIYSGPPPLSAPDVRICQANDVEVMIAHGGGATGGQVLSGMAFRNVSATPCRVVGTPAVVFLDSGGGVVPITASPTCNVGPPCGHPLEDVLLQPNTVELQQRTNQPAGQGYVSLFFQTLGPEGRPCRTSPPATIRLSWQSSGGSLSIPNTGLNPCSQVFVSWFQPAVAVP